MKRLLFCDAEPQILEALKSRFFARRKDWDMHFVGSGALAIELMQKEHFDILVTDLRMPGVDGATLISRTLVDSPDTIRIVLSGYSDAEQSQKLLSQVHRFLSKPCEPKRLEECIDRCLATHSLVDSPEMRARLGAIDSLPPIPATFAALRRAVVDPMADSRKVARIILRDPAISAKILQVCNSAFFRLPRRVTSVEQAVSHLGLSAVQSMALSAELFKPGASMPPALDLELLQRHALGVGVIARSLAAGAPWADDAFLAGLLHDVGFLILGRQCREELQAAMELAGGATPLAAAEQTCIGVDHAAVGGYLLTLWGIPYEVVDAVTLHEKHIDAQELDIGSAVAIAHTLMGVVRPQDMIAEEPVRAAVDDAYLRALRIPHTWDALVERTQATLATEEAA
jgi:HD-like signal output (HDOD) protein/ActR/RegA family two-component response regulator